MGASDRRLGPDLPRYGRRVTPARLFGFGDEDLAVSLGLLVPLALVAVVWFGFVNPRLHAAIRAEMAARAICLSCGYCLTGNVSGVCPECGTPVAA